MSPSRRASRPRARPTLWSIRNRLALMFFAITLMAVVVVYVYVAPSLESNLQAQKVSNLEKSARAALAPIALTVGSNTPQRTVNDAVRAAADRTGSHVSLLKLTPPGTLGIDVDQIVSAPTGTVPPSDMKLGLDAAIHGSVKTATLSGNGVVALPIRLGSRVAAVALFSVPLSDVLSNVSLIRREILIAGLIALAFAVLAGTLVARAISQRVKRLEDAARRVAAGDFSARFQVDSHDELGQLAGALDDMQRQLAELDNARKRFIATASHELRTPIFSLGGFLELIQDEELDEDERRQFVGQVREQVDRLGKLATGLLDLSRLEAGSIELQPKPTDIAGLASAVTSEFVPALNQHRSHLELRMARRPVRATCDPERVAQILRILIDNAITHTPPGTQIVVTAARGENGGGVTLSVLDRGEGIPPGSEERIFDPFFTSDGVLGSGLGLAIARELAERMHARIEVESAPGQTTFTLGLPA